MEKTHQVALILAVILLFLVVYSCESTNSSTGSNEVISTYNSSKSHRTGENCMNCHISNGSGDGYLVSQERFIMRV